MQDKKIVVTHNGQFHTDEVCAVAVLTILFGKDNVEIIRTRDKEVILKGDIVVDVGGFSDPERGQFDHHQLGGAGERENGVPYASFGLVWKHYGAAICKSEDVAKRIDQKMVQFIDAVDNGVAVSSPVIDGVYPYTIVDFVQSYQGLVMSFDEAFAQVVEAACSLITREIHKVQNIVLLEEELEGLYEVSIDKEIIVTSRHYPWQVLSKKPEPKFVVYPDDANNTWVAKAIRVEDHSFELRKEFPESWAGKRDKDLESVTGVEGAVFCHNKRFIVAAKTREAALELAKKALAA